MDTHVFLWLQTDPTKVGPILDRLQRNDAELVVSVASGWEIAIKYSIGRLSLPEPPEKYVPSRIKAINAVALPVELRHALAVSKLPPIHRDPFDRVLLCQAHAIKAILVTADEEIDKYPVRTFLVPTRK
ncbi:MAG: type II toxin-antitoxin system VapC family toxin [Acidimicrobiales bacterium]|nr:type II toxin-antitoxin system VapC family toxin [Acidimicrobiales bacterium]